MSEDVDLSAAETSLEDDASWMEGMKRDFASLVNEMRFGCQIV
jgi:hypothetical protein